jgi:tRNA G18 (ribose-2'-O)-methylase SpoU
MNNTFIHPNRLRGYFSIGAENISKPMNLGNLFRSAHAFGANSVFTISPHKKISNNMQAMNKSDTSKSTEHLPYYEWESVEKMQIPKGCEIVGIELLEDAKELPSFRHPMRAAYVLGAEAGSLSESMIERCDHIIKIPTTFSINVAIAGAIVMYDRVRSLGKFPRPPVTSRGVEEEISEHLYGKSMNLTHNR